MPSLVSGRGLVKWFTSSLLTNGNAVIDRYHEVLNEQQNQGGRQATARPQSAVASAQPSSTRQSYPATSPHMQQLIVAQHRLDNFASAAPRDQVAMLRAMEPHDAAKLLDGVRTTDETAKLLHEVKKKSPQQASKILGHISTEEYAVEVFTKMEELAERDASASTQQHSQTPPSSRLDPQGLGRFINDSMTDCPKEAARLIVEQTRQHPSLVTSAPRARAMILGSVQNRDVKSAISEEIDNLLNQTADPATREASRVASQEGPDAAPSSNLEDYARAMSKLEPRLAARFFVVVVPKSPETPTLPLLKLILQKMPDADEGKRTAITQEVSKMLKRNDAPPVLPTHIQVNNPSSGDVVLGTRDNPPR